MNNNEMLKKIKKSEKDIVQINEQLDNKTKKSNMEIFDNDYNLSLQELIDSDLGISKLTLNKNSVYNLTDTLLIPSNFELNLNNAKLKMLGVDKPIISKKGALQGRTIVRNGTIIGDTTMPNNKGIEINDYYSTCRDLEIINTGAQGIHCINGSASGNLVENVFKNIIFRNCQGVAFESDEGNKLTDGIIDNFIIHGANKATALKVGSGAGWIVDKVHAYGFGDVNNVIDIQNGYNTNINNIYIEGSGGIPLSIAAVQQSVNINNITIVASMNTTACVYLSKSSATKYGAYVNINNLNIVNNENKEIKSVDSDGSEVNCSLNNYSVQGAYANNVNIGSNISSRLKVINDCKVIGVLRGENGRLSLDNNSFVPYIVRKWNGSGEKTIKIPLTRLGIYEKIPFTMSLFSQKWDVQNGQVRYAVHGMISCGNDISSNSISYIEIGTPAGLSVKPGFSIDTNTKELIITFTTSSTDESDQGVLFIQFGY